MLPLEDIEKIMTIIHNDVDQGISLVEKHLTQRIVSLPKL